MPGKEPHQVTIMTSWLSLVISIFTIASTLLAVGWWVSGVRAHQIIEEAMREQSGVSADVKLYIQQTTLTKEEFKDYKESLDRRLDGISMMLQTIGYNQLIISGGKTKPVTVPEKNPFSHPDNTP